mmetsp:Transcript_91710/g.268415  ORF Transcript_91710/g.268415 Transcript_91710/m.268415 type:complete len:217 (-) Transcript_91710:1262-1912(-)
MLTCLPSISYFPTVSRRTMRRDRASWSMPCKSLLTMMSTESTGSGWYAPHCTAAEALPSTARGVAEAYLLSAPCTSELRPSGGGGSEGMERPSAPCVRDSGDDARDVAAESAEVVTMLPPPPPTAGPWPADGGGPLAAAGAAEATMGSCVQRRRGQSPGVALRRKRGPESGDCGALWRRERLWETRTGECGMRAGEKDLVAMRSAGELFRRIGGGE